MPMKPHRHQASDMVRKHSIFKRKESESYRDSIKYFLYLMQATASVSSPDSNRIFREPAYLYRDSESSPIP